MVCFRCYHSCKDACTAIQWRAMGTGDCDLRVYRPGLALPMNGAERGCWGWGSPSLGRTPPSRPSRSRPEGHVHVVVARSLGSLPGRKWGSSHEAGQAYTLIKLGLVFQQFILWKFNYKSINKNLNSKCLILSEKDNGNGSEICMTR